MAYGQRIAGSDENGKRVDIGVTGDALHTAISGAGVQEGGQKVFEVNHPSTRNQQSWFFGSEDTLETLTVAVPTKGLWQDQSVLNPDCRSVVIINGNASPAFAYTVSFSRSGEGVTTDDEYPVISSTSTSTITRVNVPATEGFDLYMTLTITPDVGQAGTELEFKSYLIGRGG